jgi:hypothetical protein
MTDIRCGGSLRTARGALAYLTSVAKRHPDSIVQMDSIDHIGALLGWERPRASRQLKAWATSGKVTVDRSSPRKIVIRVLGVGQGARKPG